MTASCTTTTALGCASAGMGGIDQYQAQAADAELKDVDVAEQAPEAPTPMDKTTGEATTRRAPDLTGFGCRTLLQNRS